MSTVNRESNEQSKGMVAILTGSDHSMLVL